MAVDSLQNKIRRGKCPLMVDLSLFPEQLPPQFQELLPEKAYGAFCAELMTALKGIVPALRFQFASAALLGKNGLDVLSELMKKASAMGFYVLLEVPISNPTSAAFAAARFWGNESVYPCDGVQLPAYPGTDLVKAFLPYCKEGKKDLFIQVRTCNKSASELQDLLTGSRQVHVAAADYVNRYAAELTGKSGFSQAAVCASATSADSLRTLRSKYPRLFLLVDGMDCSGGNAKNASFAFDKLGHGAILCVGDSVTGAWSSAENGAGEFAFLAVAAVQRHQKNLSRYVTIL